MESNYIQIVKTDIGLVRKANEDAAGYAPSSDVANNGDLFIVCDGMGGHVGGSIASNTAVQTIIEFFAKAYHENPYVAINDAIVFANEQIYARALAEPELKGMGTTCTVLLLREKEAFIGHVGDSRIYLHVDKKLRRITKDHSFVQNLVDQGIISDDQAESHPRKNELIKALGIRAQVEPEVSPKPIHAKNSDTFLMCSDGLCGLVTDDQMAAIISTDSSFENKADKLINMAKDAGGHDNITVALVQLSNSSFSTSIFPDYSPTTNTNGITGEMAPLTATQKIEPKVEVEIVPLYKQKRVQLIGGAIFLLIILLIVFWPFGHGGNKLAETNDADSLNLQSTVIITTPCDSINEVIIDADSINMMFHAINALRERFPDNYNEECLRYKSAISNIIVTGTDVSDIDNIMPNEIVWLDCDCLDRQSTDEDPPQLDESIEENPEGDDDLPQVDSATEPPNANIAQEDTTKG